MILFGIKRNPKCFRMKKRKNISGYESNKQNKNRSHHQMQALCEFSLIFVLQFKDRCQKTSGSVRIDMIKAGQIDKVA